jgi:hypothetical protein
MRIEELRTALHAEPFEPFMIRTADGREFPVRHPDAVAWEDDIEGRDDFDDEDNGEAEGPLTVVCVVPGGGREVIELALVTSLGFAPAQPKGKGRGRTKGRGKGE